MHRTGLHWRPEPKIAHGATGLLFTNAFTDIGPSLSYKLFDLNIHTQI
ncbi:MAG: hypothetical protein Ct9H90mP25_3450 [Gammaproteobacteria bacterium]|nr:MAG: hypothetical protein Ct9H90mP25_3450 [Gammaproteobacteria bacterium]